MLSLYSQHPLPLPEVSHRQTDWSGEVIRVTAVVVDDHTSRVALIQRLLRGRSRSAQETESGQSPQTESRVGSGRRYGNLRQCTGALMLSIHYGALMATIHYGALMTTIHYGALMTTIHYGALMTTIHYGALMTTIHYDLGPSKAVHWGSCVNYSLRGSYVIYSLWGSYVNYSLRGSYVIYSLWGSYDNCSLWLNDHVHEILCLAWWFTLITLSH